MAAATQSFGLLTGLAAGENFENRKDFLWKEFFRVPSNWWDNRAGKRNPRQPDFKHRITKEPLWMDGRHNPSWVRDELTRRGFLIEQCIGMTCDADAIFPSLLWACCRKKDLLRGIRIHNELQRRGLDEKYYADALITMYAKGRDLQKAQALLDIHKSSSIIPWNALITSYAREGQGQNVLDCLEQMQDMGLSPNAVTYVSVLKACAVTGAIDKGKKIHDEILRQGLLKNDIVLGNALVDMYAKFGALPQARSVLEKLPSRDVFSWTTLIAGYAQKGQGHQALECFEQMQGESIPPNTVTYVCILKACAVIGAIDKGKKIHDEIRRQGLLDHSLMLGGALVDMYAKCGTLTTAHNVLEMLPSRDVVSWNALIAGYAQKGQGQQALDCFKQMQHEGIPPSAVTYACILQACAISGDIDKGKQVHHEILRQGLLEHDIVLGGALVDMYAKCGALLQAQTVLDKLLSRNVVAWSAIISGYAQNDQGQWALNCFEQMQREGVMPDPVTYLCIVKACAVIGAVDKGNQIHNEISRRGLLEHDVVLGNALVDMYAKFGALSQAQSVLEKLPFHDVVSWNALIAGYAQEGQGQEALKCFEKMQEEGIQPDLVTFLCLLNLCSHLGLVEKGQELFDSMGKIYDLKPDVDCFTCMIDLLGRAGHLVKAVEVIQEMPFYANSEIWLCLLAACRKCVDLRVATWAFEQAVELDKCDGAAYLLMENIYVAAGMTDKAKVIEAMRTNNEAGKQLVCSQWIDVDNTVHDFCIGNSKHIQNKEIDSKQECSAYKMCQEGDTLNLNSES